MTQSAIQKPSLKPQTASIVDVEARQGFSSSSVDVEQSLSPSAGDGSSGFATLFGPQLSIADYTLQHILHVLCHVPLRCDEIKVQYIFPGVVCVGEHCCYLLSLF